MIGAYLPTHGVLPVMDPHPRHRRCPRQRPSRLRRSTAGRASTHRSPPDARTPPRRGRRSGLAPGEAVFVAAAPADAALAHAEVAVDVAATAHVRQPGRL